MRIFLLIWALLAGGMADQVGHDANCGDWNGRGCGGVQVGHDGSYVGNEQNISRQICGEQGGDGPGSGSALVCGEQGGGNCGEPSGPGELVLFWNLENFFDYRDGGEGESDAAFSARGERHWTAKRFYTKCNAIAKALLWIGGKQGRMPDVIGVAEVENAFVLRRLLQTTLLRKLDYGIVHRESPDRRGIDVALLYRKSRYDTLSVSLRKLYDGPIPLATRGILCVTLRDRTDGSVRHYLVNHHPSKFSGAAASQQRRVIAVETLRQVADSLGSGIIAMGDFNDQPVGGIYETLSGTLTGKADSLCRAGRGTIRFGGRRELIDAFFTSPEIDARMDIVEIPFLLTRDNTHAGSKPLRTYSGPRYTGGVSDHLPVLLRVQKK